MRIVESETGEPAKDSLILKGSAAEVIVQKRNPQEGKWREWAVDYEVIKFAGEFVKGRRFLDNVGLQVAFGLSNGVTPSGEFILAEYGGTTAVQGVFIRYNEYLNIPGPGTGHDGDANVSVLLTPEIIDAVKNLLGLTDEQLQALNPELLKSIQLSREAAEWGKSSRVQQVVAESLTKSQKVIYDFQKERTIDLSSLDQPLS